MNIVSIAGINTIYETTSVVPGMGDSLLYSINITVTILCHTFLAFFLELFPIMKNKICQYCDFNGLSVR